jgi:hypothetical protein
MVVSPDVGGVVRARSLARRINADLAIVDKRRERAGESEVMNIIGDVSGRNCIMIDDIVDSGGTLCNAAEALLAAGAESVHAYITHGVLSGQAAQRIAASKLRELFSNTSNAKIVEDILLTFSAIHGWHLVCGTKCFDQKLLFCLVFKSTNISINSLVERSVRKQGSFSAVFFSNCNWISIYCANIVQIISISSSNSRFYRESETS